VPEPDFAAILSFDLENPRAVAYVREHGAALVANINSTTRDYIRTVVTQGVDEGWSYDKIAKSITDRYQEFAVGKPQLHIDSRAHGIAVTETGMAYENGSRIVANDLKAAGLQMEKFWQTVEDERVSALCANNQAQGWLPIDQPFASGHQEALGHPYCRCTTLYRRLAGAAVPAEIAPPPVLVFPSAQYTGEPQWSERDASDWLTRDLEVEEPYDITNFDREVIKDTIVSSLSEASGLPYEEVNRIVAQWAQTSNDNDMRSLAMQLDAAREFNVPMSEWAKGRIADVEEAIQEQLDLKIWGISDAERLAGLRRDHPGWFELAPSQDQRKLLRTMYDQTQADLAEAGLTDTVLLYRGVTFTKGLSPDWEEGDIVSIATNAMSSWSSDEGVAGGFATHMALLGEDFGAILEMEVPVSRILSTSRTGFGCFTEAEFLVLGSSEDEAKVLERTIGWFK